jgi:hypothetical protein
VLETRSKISVSADLSVGIRTPKVGPRFFFVQPVPVVVRCSASSPARCCQVQQQHQQQQQQQQTPTYNCVLPEKKVENPNTALYERLYCTRDRMGWGNFLLDNLRAYIHYTYAPLPEYMQPVRIRRQFLSFSLFYSRRREDSLKSNAILGQCTVGHKARHIHIIAYSD